MNPLELGFRRRCGWCFVPLRAWQMNLCRLCKMAVKWDAPSAPCLQGSRSESSPDERRKWR